MKKIKIKLIYFIILLFIVFIIFGLFLIGQDTSNKFTKKIKDNTPIKIKILLKNTIFYIPIKIREYKKNETQIEKLKKENRKLQYEKIYFQNKLEFGRSNEKIIKSKKSKYKLNEFILPFFSDSNIFDNDKKGYLEIYKNKIIVFFGSGKSIQVDIDELNKNNFDYKEIKNNILSNDYFDNQILWTGIKDIKVKKNKIYLSLTKAFSNKCYNTALYYSTLNFVKLNFKEINLNNECANISKGLNSYPTFKNFNGYQNGGRIVITEKNILLTLGDYNQWNLVQKDESLFGKIIKINKFTLKHSIISKGHRNQQGMYNLGNSKIIVSEHGPKGGDEINIINIDSSKIPNYGWPISSYGEHYDSVPLNREIKKIAPLNKNHKDYGFIEPIFYFDQSIGISEIIKNYFSKSNSYFITSLKNKTIYEIVFDENFENPEIKDEINIGERIRDIVYDKKLNRYYLYLEDSPKLSILQSIID